MWPRRARAEDFERGVALPPSASPSTIRNFVVVQDLNFMSWALNFIGQPAHPLQGQRSLHTRGAGPARH
jgi:hypothetical protein